MNKPVSKHRNGGPHSGGQPQNNQRQQPMPDFQRQERSYSHGIRQGNQPGAHIASNSIPINMHLQHQAPAPQNIQTQIIQNPSMVMRNYAGTHQPLATNAAHTPSLVHQQATVPVGHVNPNTSQQAPMINYKNNTQFPNFIPSSNRMQMQQRPHYRESNNVQNVVSSQQFFPGFYMCPNQYQFQAPSNQAMIVNQAVSPEQLFYFNMNHQYQTPYQYSQRGPINIINTNNQPEINTAASFPRVKELKKREKQCAVFYDDDGNVVNLNSETKENSNQEKSTPSAETKSAPEKSTLVEEIVPVNGDQNDLEVEQNAQVEEAQDTPNEFPQPETDDQVVSSSISIQHNDEPLVESETVQCDIKAVENISEPSIVESEKSLESENVEEITEKLNDVNLDEQTKTTQLGDANEKASENLSSLQVADSVTICENIDSGDMDNESCNNAKQIDSVNVDETKVESIEVCPDENSNLVEDIKDDSATEPQPESKPSSDNASQNAIKVYDRVFLLSLREHRSKNSISNSNKEIFKDIIKKETTNDSDFLPVFAKTNRSQNDSFRYKSQGQSVRRTSQPSRNYQDAKSRKIISTSLHYEMQYKPTENAWRPGAVKSNDPVEMETENLLKSVRAILNKLTPENYFTLLKQFKKLKIDSRNRLIRVIDLIFDKAVKEPAFVVQYAGFCSQLVHIKVTEVVNDEKVEVKFNNLLIEKCQDTFFKKMYFDIPDLEERMKEIEECQDISKKKELEDILDDDKRYSRKRSVGNIKLIAELYKLNMLNAKIMFACFNNLLRNEHEDYIECLCALITNIGLNLTTEITSKSSKFMSSFDSIFNQLKEIYDQKVKYHISSRIRFMILDLLDLRKNNWVPRRKADGPKTIAQIHEDVDKMNRLKNMEINDMKKKKNYSQKDDDWQQIKHSRKSSSHSNIGSHKIGSFNLKESIEQVANNAKTSSQMPFSIFARGSHGGTNSTSQSRSSSTCENNKYSALLMDKTSRPNTTFHDSLSSKDQIGRGNNRKASDIVNYYQSDNRDSLPSSRNSSMSIDSSTVKQNINISPEEFDSKLNKFFNSNLNGQESKAIDDLTSFCSQKNFHNFVCKSILIAIDKSSHDPVNPRIRWGKFLGSLFVSSPYDFNQINEGLKLLFSQSSEWIIDLPKFWEFVAEVIAHALLTIYKKNYIKELFSAITQSFDQIERKDNEQFKNAIFSTLKQEDDEIAQEFISFLVSYFQKTSKTILFSNAKNDSEFKKLDKIIESYINNKNYDFSGNVEKTFSDKLNSSQFKSALYRKILISLIKYVDNDVYSIQKQDHLLESLRKYITSNDDQLLLLSECTQIVSEINYPMNLLQEFCILFFDSQLVCKEVFAHWHKCKSIPGVARATVERLIERILK